MGSGRKREEAAKEKVRLKREEHRLLLEKTKALLSRNPPAATITHPQEEQAADVSSSAPSQVAPPEYPLETSLVEPGPSLVSLNPFPEEEGDEEEPDAGTHFAQSTVETETVSQVTTEAYIHVPAEDIPTSAGVRSGKKAP